MTQARESSMVLSLMNSALGVTVLLTCVDFSN